MSARRWEQVTYNWLMSTYVAFASGFATAEQKQQVFSIHSKAWDAAYGA